MRLDGCEAFASEFTDASKEDRVQSKFRERREMFRFTLAWPGRLGNPARGGLRDAVERVSP